MSRGRLLVRRSPAPATARLPRGLEPIVKWAGSKRKLVKELAARMPARYGRYFEPFAGSAALCLHCGPNEAVISDTNGDLIQVYRDVARHMDSLIADLRYHAERHSEDFYYHTRERWNGGFYDPPNTNRSAAFLYLNKTCFNGLWRVNSKNEFNVPMGDYKNPRILNEAELRAAAPAFARADLRVCDYRETATEAGKGDFVYFDPPYIPTSSTAAFTSYTADVFGEDHHRELAGLARRLVARGVQVMLSNSDTPLALELYQGFQIDRVSRSGAINSDPTKRGAVSELVITGGYVRSTSTISATPAAA